MSKVLYLMRHGKAEDNPGVSDHDRALVDRGIRDVRHQAQNHLSATIPDKFIVSPSLRTSQTAQHIMEELEFSAGRIQYEGSMYLASVRQLLEVVNNLDNLWNTVCLIGHNPSITYLAEYLTKDPIGSVKAAGIVKISYDGTWEELSEGSAYLDDQMAP